MSACEQEQSHATVKEEEDNRYYWSERNLFSQMMEVTEIQYSSIIGLFSEQWTLPDSDHLFLWSFSLCFDFEEKRIIIMAGPGDEFEKIDLYDVCIEGDYASLKSILEERKDVDVNEYKLFVYHPSSNHSNELDRFEDGEDEYQADDEQSDSGTMFDYRSPLFYVILHDRLACVKLLIEHGADTNKLRFFLF